MRNFDYSVTNINKFTSGGTQESCLISFLTLLSESIHSEKDIIYLRKLIFKGF